MRFFWIELVVVAAISISGNAVHAVLNAPPRLAIVAAIVAMVPPILLLVATHGVGALVRARSGANFAYWIVALLTAAIAAIAFRLSFNALQDLAVQVGTAHDLAWLFPVIIDGAIGQATVALLVLARTQRTEPQPAVRTDAEPTHHPDSLRTTSVREVHTEMRSTSTELTESRALAALEPEQRTAIGATAPADQWSTIADQICKADPYGRRQPETVAEILRLKYEHGWTHSRIAEQVELSASAVTRTLTAAHQYTDREEPM